MHGWTFDGGEPPDFDDLDSLERFVIPELERLITESGPGSVEWITWAILLGTVRNRILMVRRLADLDGKLNELAEHITDSTDAGIREVISGMRGDGESDSGGASGSARA